MSVSILIAEDDPLLRTLVERVLAGEEDLQVIGAAANGEEALEMIERLRPNVLLLDLIMPRLPGLAVLEHLAQMEERPAVLVLSTEEDEETQLEAVRNGARGFLPKAQAAANLAKAVRAVAVGDVWYSRRLSHLIFSEFPNRARRQREQERPANQLTERECEVLRRVAQGMTNSQIARDLHMSVSTVKTHVQNIFQKFDLPNRTEAAVFAVRQGLLESDDAHAARLKRP
jgi:DNA-binding NarL/FixJ family response regulator